MSTVMAWQESVSWDRLAEWNRILWSERAAQNSVNTLLMPGCTEVKGQLGGQGTIRRSVVVILYGWASI